jgi:DNA-binding winged helix-turn-helix (wHTH) protein
MQKILKTYFDPGLDLRKQSFNLLACAGIAAGLIAALVSALAGTGVVQVTINLGAAAFAFFLIQFAHRTGRYNFCFVLTVVVVFLIAFPALFYTGGGYQSGMPGFFIFAIVFTARMLEGKTRTVFIIVEMVLYIGSCIIAYLFPDTVTQLQSEPGILADVIVGFVLSSIILLLVFLLYIRIYNRRQAQVEIQAAELAERNKELEQYRIIYGPLTLELVKSTALIDGLDINLTKKEFAVLLMLVQNDERGMFAEEIYEHVWGAPMGDDTKAIRNHMSNLRRKISAKTNASIEIQYSNSNGYQFILRKR